MQQNKCIICTMAKRIAQGIFETVFVAVCGMVILAIPLGIIKAAILLLGEKTTALLGAGGILLALIACVICSLVKLYHEVKRECQ